MNTLSGDVVLSDAISLLKSQPTGSVPLIVTDPPYGVAYHSNHYKDKNPHAPVTNDWNFQIHSFMMEADRCLTDGGAMYMFSRWDVYPIWFPAFASLNMKLKTKIIWVKNNWSAGDLYGSFGVQYEEMLLFTKGRHRLRSKRYSNVWSFDRVPAQRMLHPTQKPVPLLKRAIESSSDVGDLVIDPFCGSGSTGVAAKETGRLFLLGDLDPRMVRMSKMRLGMEVESEEEMPALPMPTFEYPSPEDWGIHPEDLLYIFHELTGNSDRLVSEGQTRFLV